MAITVTKKGLTIEIKGTTGTIDADWDYTATINDTGVFVESIQLVPATIGDKCVIKEGGATGPIMFQYEAAALSDPLTKNFNGKRKHPFLDVGDGSYTSGAKVLIELSE